MEVTANSRLQRMVPCGALIQDMEVLSPGTVRSMAAGQLGRLRKTGVSFLPENST